MGIRPVRIITASYISFITDIIIVWEGSDDWLRVQFHGYLLSMLAAANSEQDEYMDEFNAEFIKAWRTRHNYRVWSCGSHKNFVDVSPRLFRLKHSKKLKNLLDIPLPAK